jgi:hypothetical protein
MSLEAWGSGDEFEVPDGYVTEEHADEMVQDALQKAADMIRERIEAFRSGHANDSSHWEHFNTGLADGLTEALGIVEAVRACRGASTPDSAGGQS